MKRFSGTRAIRIGRPPGQAMWFFTPEGERAWAPGWAPAYPDGPPAGDGSEPGTVFLTTHGRAETVWTVLDRDERRVRYSRVTPGVWAGTVEVRLRELPEGETAAEVTYDLTALSDAGAAHLEEFAAAFEHDIGGWEDAIGAAGL